MTLDFSPKTRSLKLVLKALLGHVHTLLDSFCTASKIILDGASVHTQEWFWGRDFCDGAKLRHAELKVKHHISDRCSHWFSVNTYSAHSAEVNKSERGLETTETEINIQKGGLGFSATNPLGQPRPRCSICASPVSCCLYSNG